jgi:hypothetical protein
MLPKIRRPLVAVVLAPVVALGLCANAPAASAAPAHALNLSFLVNATTHLAKSGMDITIPQGTFTGKLNTGTGKITGNLSLPPAQKTISLAGIGLATATLALAPTRAATGQLDLQTGQLTTTSVFNIDITSLTVLGLPVNLVGSNCATSKPVHATVSGLFSLTGSTLTGTYTIPPFSNCELPTTAINLLLPGPGNTLSAAFTLAS